MDAHASCEVCDRKAGRMELVDEVLDLGLGPAASPRIRGWNVHSPPTTTARTAPYTMGLGERLHYSDSALKKASAGSL